MWGFSIVVSAVLAANIAGIAADDGPCLVASANCLSCASPEYTQCSICHPSYTLANGLCRQKPCNEIVQDLYCSDCDPNAAQCKACFSEPDLPMGLHGGKCGLIVDFNDIPGGAGLSGKYRGLVFGSGAGGVWQAWQAAPGESYAATQPGTVYAADGKPVTFTTTGGDTFTSFSMQSAQFALYAFPSSVPNPYVQGCQEKALLKVTGYSGGSPACTELVTLPAGAWIFQSCAAVQSLDQVTFEWDESSPCRGGNVPFVLDNLIILPVPIGF